MITQEFRAFIKCKDGQCLSVPVWSVGTAWQDAKEYVRKKNIEIKEKHGIMGGTMIGEPECMVDVARALKEW